MDKDLGGFNIEGPNPKFLGPRNLLPSMAEYSFKINLSSLHGCKDKNRLTSFTMTGEKNIFTRVEPVRMIRYEFFLTTNQNLAGAGVEGPLMDECPVESPVLVTKRAYHPRVIWLSWFIRSRRGRVCWKIRRGHSLRGLPGGLVGFLSLVLCLEEGQSFGLLPGPQKSGCLLVSLLNGRIWESRRGGGAPGMGGASVAGVASE